MPPTTPWKSALLLAVAFASFTRPPAGDTAVSESTCTRIPSYFSNSSIAPAGSASAAIKTMCRGSGAPGPSNTTEVGVSTCVLVGLLGD